MELQERNAPPERRGGGHTLTVDHPLTKTALAGLDLSGADIAEVKRFANALGREAARWKLRGGFGERGRVSKADAARMFAKAFPASSILLSAYPRQGGER